MPSNFQLFDASQGNMLSDAAYTTIQERLTGNVDGLASAPLFNKYMLQQSAMVYSIGQVLSDAGFTVADNNQTALIAALKAMFANPALLQYWHGSAAPLWLSGTTFSMAHLAEIDTSGSFVIQLPTSILFNAATIGLNGLDTGSGLIANSFYYPFAVSDGQVGALHNGVLLSLNPTVPSSANFNYSYYRPLDWAYRTVGDSTFIRELVIQFGFASFVKYISFFGAGTTPGTTNILAGGTSGAFADLDATPWLPIARSTMPYLKIKGRNIGGNLIIWVRQKGDTSDGTQTQDNNACFLDIFDTIPTDNNGFLQYSSGIAGGSNTGAFVDVAGYWANRRV